MHTPVHLRAAVAVLCSTLVFGAVGADSSVAALPETLTLNTHASLDSPPTVTTETTLNAGALYSVTVAGTYSIGRARRWTVRPGRRVVCGSALQLPLFNSPGVLNGPTGRDAATVFAVPGRSPGTCASGTLPRAHQRLLMNIGPGGAFINPQPVSGPGTRQDHVYTYEVTGTDAPLSVRLADSPVNDNYGLLQIVVTEAGSGTDPSTLFDLSGYNPPRPLPEPNSVLAKAWLAEGITSGFQALPRRLNPLRNRPAERGGGVLRFVGLTARTRLEATVVIVASAVPAGMARSFAHRVVLARGEGAARWNGTAKVRLRLTPRALRLGRRTRSVRAVLTVRATQPDRTVTVRRRVIRLILPVPRTRLVSAPRPRFTG